MSLVLTPNTWKSCGSNGKAVPLCALAGLIGPLAAALPAFGDDSITPFEEQAIARGVIYEIQGTAAGSPAGYGWGIAIADLNANGAQDVVLMGHASAYVGFFENDGSGHFTDRSFISPGVPKHKLTRPSGLAVADFNGDGLLDLYITQAMNVSAGITFPSKLLRNDGDFQFTDAAPQAGVTNDGNGQGAAWGDFDDDGWLDLYVANYGLVTTWNQQVHKNKLYRNLGESVFADVSVSQGVDDHGQGFTAAFTDINRNGRLDLYLANDRGNLPGYSPNQLWRNDDGQFVNICATSGACLGLAAMCVGVGDVTGNGYPDIYITNLAHPSVYNGWSPLIVNHGNETFSQQCVPAGVCNVAVSWAGIFFDYSNNGWLDLYVINQYPTSKHRLYANTGTFPLKDVAHLAGVGGDPGWAYNAAAGDVTGNGALDLLLNDAGDGVPQNAQLFINQEGLKRNWVRFDVVGKFPNLHAIGANIEVTAQGHVQWREIYAGGNNFKAQNELVFHFGLGDAVMADQIVVNWPGGQVQRVLTSYPANHRWTIHPPQSLGDFNGDGVIGVPDLLALLQAWGPVKPGGEIMDLDSDGSIGTADLLLLLAKWGSS